MGQSWEETETAGCDLGDVRLNRRLGTILEALGERPGKSLPTAFQDWSNRPCCTKFIRSVADP
nr:transposase [Pseudoruegeria sp. SK021]